MGVDPAGPASPEQCRTATPEQCRTATRPIASPGGLVSRRVRDLLVLDCSDCLNCLDRLNCGQPGDELLVLACDSAGGVGPKPLDGVSAPARVVGLFTARVALMEVMAAGAAPVAVTATICCEPQPTGDEVASGVVQEMAAAGLGPGALIISTEKNLDTVQTGVGVTVLGMVSRSAFLPGRARPGDAIALVGCPKVGAAVTEGDPAIVDLPSVAAIIRSGLAADLVPVGSRGAWAEACELAGSAGLTARRCPDEGGPDDFLTRSGGPATALVAAVRPEAVAELTRVVLPKPCRLIGHLESADPGRGGI